MSRMLVISGSSSLCGSGRLLASNVVVSTTLKISIDEYAMVARPDSVMMVGWVTPYSSKVCFSVSTMSSQYSLNE